MANLRIIYQNLADISTAVVTASTTASAITTPASNLKSDIRNSVWRSGTGTTDAKANLAINFPSTTFPTGTILGIVLTNTNLTSTATIQVKIYNTAAVVGGTADAPTTSGTVVNTGSVVVCSPYQSLGFNNWTTDIMAPVSLAPTEYKNRKVYSRVFLAPLGTNLTCQAITLEIIDTANTNNYVEASRIIVGPVWSPTYNTGYGLAAGTRDLSTSVRTEAGDLISSPAAKINTLSFDLRYMNTADRTIFNKLSKLLGTSKPLFVSLFPDNTTDWEKEQLYQLYGKLTQIPNIENSTLDIYSSTVEMEEI